MRTNNFYRTLVVAAVSAVMLGVSGCDQLTREHNKFVETDKKQWNKTRLEFMYEVAEQDYKVGDYDKCREKLKEALAVDAPYAPIHVLAAKVDLEEEGNLEDASTQLKKAIEINAADAEPYYLLGVVYQRWQKWETAEDYYQQASTRKPSEALYVLAVAEVKISLGQLDEAKQMLEDKEMYFEQSAAMRIALARIASLQGEHEAAVKHLRDATLLSPEDKNIRWSYAQALFDAGKFSDASKILEDMRNDPPTLPKAPDSITKGEDPTLAEQAANSTKVSLLMTLGECYVSLKRPADARDCFQEVIRTQPENLSAYLSLGKSCMLTNEYNLSLAAAKKVLRLQPENKDALILQAAVLQKQKKWSEALETLQTVARISPKDSTVLCMEGMSALQLGRKDQATDFIEQAVAVNPTDAWANELLSRVKPAVAPAPATPAPATPVPSLPAESATPAAQAPQTGTPILAETSTPAAKGSETSGSEANASTSLSNAAGVSDVKSEGTPAETVSTPSTPADEVPTEASAISKPAETAGNAQTGGTATPAEAVTNTDGGNQPAASGSGGQ